MKKNSTAATIPVAQRRVHFKNELTTNSDAANQSSATKDILNFLNQLEQHRVSDFGFIHFVSEHVPPNFFVDMLRYKFLDLGNSEAKEAFDAAMLGYFKRISHLRATLEAGHLSDESKEEMQAEIKTLETERDFIEKLRPAGASGEGECEITGEKYQVYRPESKLNILDFFITAGVDEQVPWLVRLRDYIALTNHKKAADNEASTGGLKYLLTLEINEMKESLKTVASAKSDLRDLPPEERNRRSYYRHAYNLLSPIIDSEASVKSTIEFLYGCITDAESGYQDESLMEALYCLNHMVHGGGVNVTVSNFKNKYTNSNSVVGQAYNGFINRLERPAQASSPRNISVKQLLDFLEINFYRSPLIKDYQQVLTIRSGVSWLIEGLRGDPFVSKKFVPVMYIASLEHKGNLAKAVVTRDISYIDWDKQTDSLDGSERSSIEEDADGDAETTPSSMPAFPDELAKALVDCFNQHRHELENNTDTYYANITTDLKSTSKRDHVPALASLILQGSEHPWVAFLMLWVKWEELQSVSSEYEDLLIKGLDFCIQTLQKHPLNKSQKLIYALEFMGQVRAGHIEQDAESILSYMDQVGVFESPSKVQDLALVVAIASRSSVNLFINDMILKLLELGANPNAFDGQPMALAIRALDTDLISLLMNYNANTDSALVLAEQLGDRNSLIELIHTNKKEITMKDFEAALKELEEWMKDKTLDTALAGWKKEFDGLTKFQIASIPQRSKTITLKLWAHIGSLELIRYFTSKGFYDLNNEAKETASARGHTPIVEFLEHQAALRQSDSLGRENSRATLRSLQVAELQKLKLAHSSSYLASGGPRQAGAIQAGVASTPDERNIIQIGALKP